MAGALATLVALWLAWIMTSHGLATHFAPTRPALALALAPNLPDAVVAVVKSRLTRGRPLEAARLARQVIAGDPLNTDALRTLGLALAQADQTASADSVMDFAAARTWRNTLLQAWIFRRRLRQGRIAAAFCAADALLRRDIDPDLRTRLDEVLSAAAGYDATRGALAARLSAAPSWRMEFIERLVATGDLDRARAVLLALAAGPTPPNSAEVGPYIARLVEARRFPRAIADWSTLTGRGGPARTLLADGGFQGGPDGTAFTWSRTEGAGGSEEIRPAPRAIGGNALGIVYDGFAAPEFPRQLVVLAPGRYRLSGFAWLESGQDDGRLHWTAACADGAGPLAQSGARAAPDAWRPMELIFDVPSSNCSGQWLGVSPEAGERRRPVVIWYAGLRLDPVQ